MGTLLRTELRYSLPAWRIGYAICAAVLVAAVMLPKWDVFGYMLNTTITYFILMGILGASMDGEKRTRAQALLPIPPREVALCDLAYVALFQLGMVALWLAFLAFKPEFATGRTLWGMVTQNGLTLGLIALFIIHTHLGFFGAHRYRRITHSLGVAFGLSMGLLTYTGWMGPFARWIGRHYVSWSGALTATLLWLALFWLSVVLYERRRSYLA